MRCAVLLLISLMHTVSSISTAQLCNLYGRVVDEETGQPLELANVFLASTTSGISSDTRGGFVLNGVPSGEYNLVISRVGYQRMIREISLEPGATLEFLFRLKRRELQTEEMQVHAPDPSEWRRLLGLFTKVFVGQTENARRCTIRNPYHLDLRFDEAHSTLTARCDSPLIVENRSLGYLLSIEIDQFEWDSKHERVRYLLFPRFHNLTQMNDDSAAWADSREKTYRGSLKHFLKSAITGTLAKEMFVVYSGSVEELTGEGGRYLPLNGLHVVADSLSGVHRMSFKGWIRIDYRPDVPGTRKLLTLHAPYVRVDEDGNVITRYGVETGGTWSKCGVADLLPLH